MEKRSPGSDAGRRRVRRIHIPFRSLLKWLVRLRRSPRAIAGGFALGAFIAFTPTIGVQILIVIFLATLLNLNRPAAILPVWVTNAATMVPIYTFNYWVGSLFLDGPPVSDVYAIFADISKQVLKLDVWEMRQQFETLLALSTDIMIPLLIGSIIVGAVAALICYLIAISLIFTILARRRRRQQLH